ncbi:PhzF family phenazine biosynthesis protein, partial [Raoultella ornithinolytica]
MKEIPMYLVSAFSERPFAGNPAAVCLLDAWLADDILLKMAQEHN